MVRATGQLELDEQGHWDYQGHSSGLTFMQRLREQFGELMGPDPHTYPSFKRRPTFSTLESPRSNIESPTSTNSQGAELPSREVARQLCEYALDDAMALARLNHHPTFWKNFEKIYDTAPEDYGNKEHQFLPLLYVVMALGSLFAREERYLDAKGYDNAIDEGCVVRRDTDGEPLLTCSSGSNIS